MSLHKKRLKVTNYSRFHFFSWLRDTFTKAKSFRHLISCPSLNPENNKNLQ